MRAGSRRASPRATSPRRCPSRPSRARTSYHRSLDLLRRNGWKGFGPVPWAHEPNRGFLRSLAVLADGSERLGDVDEAHRCREFLRESSPEAYAILVG